MVRCSKCSFENKSIYQFCLSCGERLPPSDREPEQPLPDDLSGCLVSRYRIGDRIGYDDISHLYVARHENPDIDKKVVLRILTPASAARDDVLRRFRDEARELSGTPPDGVDIVDFCSLANDVGSDERRVAMVFGADDGSASIVAFFGASAES